MKHYNITISGLVQGVCYRDETKKKADKLGIFGYVKDQDDGTVYVEAEGESSKLDELVEWCKTGPKMAKVTGVSMNEAAIQGFSIFEVQW